ncbi:leucine-rich repeat-containing protein 58-like [Lingula anatina]|uniref:Leucine-rich repeat-containing protein 58-like n=1 Tax=Lingula anatina TaxID=7574 RepID=A0A1S3IRR4_LINAN|nr:leucine-rich repeat-containing protein 58-like [Lingula anatina]|eukprot:XP_013400621.1 leucine-rich repeat-containing protein 58-like [Lingula anatina]
METLDSEASDDLSYCDLDSFPEVLLERSKEIQSLQLSHNQITILPRSIGAFVNLIALDLSNNGLSYISDEIIHLKQLKTLIARNNALDQAALPKEFAVLNNLEVVNFSGNNFSQFPLQLTQMPSLRRVYLGSNRLQSVPNDIKFMIGLEILYLGGNNLTEIPAEIGHLSQLTALNLCDNKLQSLPPTLMNLQKLQSLSLHNNSICVLPQEIVALDLVELSLRNNPLVARFVQDLVYKPPSLLELAGRVLKTKAVQYEESEVPRNLVDYLASAQSCVNPRCKGVYFTSRWEHVKFVDFCGKYRVPLLQYLCAPNCTPASPLVSLSSSDSEPEDDIPVVKMKKVLLG